MFVVVVVARDAGLCSWVLGGALFFSTRTRKKRLPPLQQERANK
jgi:hypothetical protein